MMATIIAFANTGKPSTRDVEWPAWTPQSQQYVSFGDKVTIEKVNTQRLDFMTAHRPAAAPPAPRPTGFPRD